MSMIQQLIYASRSFGFDDAMLNANLMDTRRCNERDNITGALICRADLYLQLLKGPRHAVEAAYQQIAADDRHLEVGPLCKRQVSERLFPEWAMCDDPVRSWMWTQADLEAGAVEHATEAEVINIFARLAKEPAE